MKPKISFFFPAYNDAGTVEKLVVKAEAVFKEVTEDYEIIIVNDGSLDDTAKEADRMASLYEKVKVIHHPYNIGYGAALKTGFLAAQYDLVFYTDGDMQYDLNEIKLLLPLLAKADIVSGYRKKRRDKLSRCFTSKLYNMTVRFLFGLKIRDVDAAFKVIKKKVLDDLSLICNGGFICVELFEKALAKGYKIEQIAVSHYPRTYGSSSCFGIFFILRSLLELMDLWWIVKMREWVYRCRHSFWEKVYRVKK